MRAGGVCVTLAIGVLLVGCGDDGEVVELEEAALGDQEQEADPGADPQAHEDEDSEAPDQGDAPAVGDVIEGTYDAGPPPEEGAAMGCTWLVTDEQTFNLMHVGGGFDEDLRAEYDGYVLELDGIGHIEEGTHMDAAEQIVALGERLRLTVTAVHTVADFGPIRDGCGAADDLLLEFDEVEPLD
jgi:hypothetical protein